MFSDVLLDKVSLVKEDGQRLDDISASVGSEMIVIQEISLPVQEGDKIIRELPNGQTEIYLIIDTGYQREFYGVPAHYSMKVRKQIPANLDRKTPLFKHNVDYVDINRLDELKEIEDANFDLSKLITLCDELNKCYANDCLLAVAMLTRAILDHVPPIFRCKTFAEVANSYPGSKSFKASMQHLETSSRKIADSHLHVQIRSKEALPSRVQVNFSNDLDVLLAEIARILK